MELVYQFISSTVVYDGEQYRTKPCDFCSCAQCSTSKTETINGIETQLYYNCSCDSDEENNNCACLGCRQERSRTTAKNSYGLTTRESQNYNGKELFTEYNYTSNCNYLASTVGSDGKAVYYNYNADTGLLDSYGYEQNGGNIVNPVTYSYNAVGALLSVSQTATDLNNSNLTIKSDYTYNGDKLTSVSHDGTSYSFEYDHYGNTTSAKVNGNNIVNYTYPDHRNVGSITYANGLTISYHYDQDKNITSLKYNNAEKFAYEYTDGVLSKSVDFANMLVTYYSDDTTVTKRFALNGENIVDGDF